ncbi:hypothetical protein [Nonomuraea salmonea]|uniref:hypothetical protein n=1 Tax=Nonomuraea salmonea TaxID=46181 RepID=UPI002FE9C5AE
MSCCPPPVIVSGGGGGGEGGTYDPGMLAVPVVLCDDNGPFVRRFVFDAETGAPSGPPVDTALDGSTAYTPSGQVGVCGPAASDPGSQVCPSRIVERCRCDDADGDGIAEVTYTELLLIDGCTGEIKSVGTYTADLSAAYTAVAPMPCQEGGVPPAVTAQARRVVLEAGQTWNLDDHAGVKTLSLTSLGQATITTEDGATPLIEGESVGWSTSGERPGGAADG